MTITQKEVRDYRESLVRRFEDEKRQIETEMAILKAKHVQAEAKLTHLKLELPSPECCPICYYLEARTSLIRPIGAADNAPKIDRWRCEAGHDW